MTLAELIAKSTGVASRYTSAWIPLKYNGRDADIDLVPREDEHGDYVIDVRIKKS